MPQSKASFVTFSEPKYLGVSAPISLNQPTELDLELTKSLEDHLKEFGFFESEEESFQREIVLGKLDALVRDFVMDVGMKQNMTREEAKLTGGKIFTFGSYRLGVHSSGADIDTLCVVPRHVERSDFFGSFFERLQQISSIKELTQVPDAYVPVIKLVYDGIAIDLLFARLNLQSIPEDLNLLDHNLLRNLDEKCILSLNGLILLNYRFQGY